MEGLLENLDQDSILSQTLRSKYIFYIVPMLNPDGAQVYSRLNANHVDLNRDAVKRVAKESQLLRSRLENFDPEFCFNLHDQRTIFGVSGTDKPATISFLAPSEEVTRKLTDGRKKTMNVIAAMNQVLQEMIPNHVGRYTDEFYPTATGDNFQKLGYPTILIESGHYKDDYAREKVRYFIFSSLLVAIDTICNNEKLGTEYEAYFDIPMNQKLFYDIIIRDATLGTKSESVDIAVQYKEVLEGKTIKFKPEIRTIGQLQDYYAHREVNAGKTLVMGAKKQKLFEGYANDFVFINNELFSLKL